MTWVPGWQTADSAATRIAEEPVPTHTWSAPTP